MSPGDIVLIRFPQADLQAGKLRPVLVVAVAPGRHPDLLVAMITSRAHQSVADFDEVIDVSDFDFDDSGLKATSYVHLARLMSIVPTVVNARLGSITPERLRRIRDRLAEWLHMPSPTA